jgi:Mg2+ and Co2+ transporter CorA
MEEYQRRIDRLTSVVTAIISIDDSRRGQDDNRNVARLTWLATFFIPLGYMASLFSMQSDISTLKDTYRLYFETALPLAAGTLGLALILGLPSVQRYVRRMVNSLKPGNG